MGFSQQNQLVVAITGAPAPTTDAEFVPKLHKLTRLPCKVGVNNGCKPCREPHILLFY